MSRIVAATSALAIAGATLLTGAASAAPAQCGYYEVGDDGMYNHCPHDTDMIEVYINNHDGSKEQTCVRTGITRIGSASKIEFAWSTRQRCRV